MLCPGMGYKPNQGGQTVKAGAQHFLHQHSFNGKNQRPSEAAKGSEK